MCQFIETICFEKGEFQHLELHNNRCNRTRARFFNTRLKLSLESFLCVPELLKKETVKCKITYGKEVIGIEYEVYNIRSINSLRLVRDDSIDYSFKYADRSKLNVLFNLRGQCDDILIVKNGLVTDTSYANIVFKKNEVWYSPLNPLLHGTQLDHYIRNGRIRLAPIRPDDLPGFTEARIINAMISIENSPIIPIKNILL